MDSLLFKYSVPVWQIELVPVTWQVLLWLIAVFGMATAMVESTLAQVYKVRDKDGQFRGGPSYYMENGLGKRWMGVLFAFLLILAFGLVFSAVQANTISGAMSSIFGIFPATVGGS